MYQTLSNTFEISKNNSPPQNSIKMYRCKVTILLEFCEYRSTLPNAMHVTQELKQMTDEILSVKKYCFKNLSQQENK